MYSCPVCGKQYKTLRGLNRHLFNVHRYAPAGTVVRSETYPVPSGVEAEKLPAIVEESDTLTCEAMAIGRTVLLRVSAREPLPLEQAYEEAAQLLERCRDRVEEVLERLLAEKMEREAAAARELCAYVERLGVKKCIPLARNTVAVPAGRDLVFVLQGKPDNPNVLILTIETLERLVEIARSPSSSADTDWGL